MIKAEIIADSISPQHKRLRCFKLRYPKFIHGEFMTHRLLSRNASSSRAIPTAKLIEEVRSDHLRAAPVFWGANQKGMQAAEELDNTRHTFRNPYEPYGPLLTARTRAQITWDQAARHAADFAEEMLEVGTHKQIVNRLLEPFSHINVVASGTEWDNFFGLRLHKDAQPEMRALAEAMWAAQEESIPEELQPGDWHLPFIRTIDHAEAQRFSDASAEGGHWLGRWAKPIDVLLWISTSRCARVSYESFETGKASTIEEDVKLFQRLIGAQPLHASPAEHQATPDENVGNEVDGDIWANLPQWGNFTQWRQHRKMLKNEACAPLPEAYQP